MRAAFVLAACLALAIAVPKAHSPTGSPGIPILFDAPGATFTRAMKLNDFGDVVGAFRDSAGHHGFIRTFDGSFTTIDVPGASVHATDINNHGTVVGISTGSGGWQGFVRERDGGLTAISVPGSQITEAHGINDEGFIVGWFLDATGFRHGFVRDPEGTFNTIDVPGATETVVNDINAQGTMVGYVQSPFSSMRGFIRNASGAVELVNVPGFMATQFSAISDEGVIVGTVHDATTRTHGLLRDGAGATTIFDVPGMLLTNGFGINIRGEISGSVLDANVRSRGFLILHDVTAPALHLPGEVYADAVGPTGAPVAYAVAAADDFDPNPAVNCQPPSGSVFPLLRSTVTCTAIDASGNAASASFDVIVKDANWQLEDMQAWIRSYNLSTLGGSLIDKLTSVRRFNAAGKLTQACENLLAFTNQIASQLGKGLTVEQGAELTAAAIRIRAVIGCER